MAPNRTCRGHVGRELVCLIQNCTIVASHLTHLNIFGSRRTAPHIGRSCHCVEFGLQASTQLSQVGKCCSCCVTCATSTSRHSRRSRTGRCVPMPDLFPRDDRAHASSIVWCTTSDTCQSLVKGQTRCADLWDRFMARECDAGQDGCSRYQ